MVIFSDMPSINKTTPKEVDLSGLNPNNYIEEDDVLIALGDPDTTIWPVVIAISLLWIILNGIAIIFAIITRDIRAVSLGLLGFCLVCCVLAILIFRPDAYCCGPTVFCIYRPPEELEYFYIYTSYGFRKTPSVVMTRPFLLKDAKIETKERTYHGADDDGNIFTIEWLEVDILIRTEQNELSNSIPVPIRNPLHGPKIIEKIEKILQRKVTLSTRPSRNIIQQNGIGISSICHVRIGTANLV